MPQLEIPMVEATEVIDKILEKSAWGGIKEEIKNIKIGGRNLLKGSMDFSGCTSAIATSTETYMGFSVKNAITQSGQTDICKWYKDTLPAQKPSTTYVVSFYAKKNGDFTGTLNCYLYGGDLRVAETEDSNGKTSPREDGDMQFTSNELSTQWKRYWVKWTMKSEDINGQTDVSKMQGNSLLIRSENATNVSVCGVMFEEATKDSNWSPAPEDLVFSGIVASAKTSIRSLAHNETVTVNFTVKKQGIYAIDFVCRAIGLTNMAVPGGFVATINNADGNLMYPFNNLVSREFVGIPASAIFDNTTAATNVLYDLSIGDYTVSFLNGTRVTLSAEYSSVFGIIVKNFLIK